MPQSAVFWLGRRRSATDRVRRHARRVRSRASCDLHADGERLAENRHTRRRPRTCSPATSDSRSRSATATRWWALPDPCMCSSEATDDGTCRSDWHVPRAKPRRISRTRCTSRAECWWLARPIFRAIEATAPHMSTSATRQAASYFAATLVPTDSHIGDAFGCDVSVASGVIVIGAPSVRCRLCVQAQQQRRLGAAAAARSERNATG